MEPPLLMRVLAASVELANHASSIIRAVYNSKDLRIIDKGGNDPQSKADRDAQRCVVQSLTKSFPGLCIIGEEGQLDPGNFVGCNDFSPEVLSKICPAEFISTSIDDLVVWVDPLDGTKEFTEGLVEHVTVLIGLAVDGKPVGGVVAQPFYKPEFSAAHEYITRVVWSLVGLGVFGIDPKPWSDPHPFPINPNASVGSIPHKIIVTRSHPSSSLTAVIKSFGSTEILRYGGCGFKVLKLLEGCGHVYVYPSKGTKKWDTCAPEALLLAMGGSLTDMFGQPYDYCADVKHMNSRGILATCVADWLPKYVNQVPKQVLNKLLIDE